MSREVAVRENRGGQQCGDCPIEHYCLMRAQKRNRCQTPDEMRIRSHVGMVRYDLVSRYWMRLFVDVIAVFILGILIYSGVLWPVS